MSARAEVGAMVWVRAGKLWRAARIVALDGRTATVKFPGTDAKHKVEASELRRLSRPRTTEAQA
jgi:hypothetical protein